MAVRLRGWRQTKRRRKRRIGGTMETGEFEIRIERLLLRSHRPEDVEDVFEFARDLEWGR